MAKIIANHKITIYGTNTRQTLNMGVADFFVLNSIEAYKAGVLLDTPDLSFYMTKAGITQVEGRFTLGNEVKLPEGDTVDLITMWIKGDADPDVIYLVGISYGTGSFNDLTTISYNKDLSLIAQATQKTVLNQNQGGNWELISSDRVSITGNITLSIPVSIPVNKVYKKMKLTASWDQSGVQDFKHADIFVYLGNTGNGTGGVYHEIAANIGVATDNETAVIVGSNSTELVLENTIHPTSNFSFDYLLAITVKNYNSVGAHRILYDLYAIIEDA